MQQQLYTYFVLICLIFCSTDSWCQGSVDLHNGAWQYTFRIEEINSYPQFKEQHQVLFDLFDGSLHWNDELHQISAQSFHLFNEEFVEEWLEEENLNLLDFHQE